MESSGCSDTFYQEREDWYIDEETFRSCVSKTYYEIWLLCLRRWIYNLVPSEVLVNEDRLTRNTCLSCGEMMSPLNLARVCLFPARSTTLCAVRVDPLVFVLTTGNGYRGVIHGSGHRHALRVLFLQLYIQDFNMNSSVYDVICL